MRRQTFSTESVIKTSFSNARILQNDTARRITTHSKSEWQKFFKHGFASTRITFGIALVHILLRTARRPNQEGIK